MGVLSRGPQANAQQLGDAEPSQHFERLRHDNERCGDGGDVGHAGLPLL
jgi:hypothetical protein